MIRFGPKAKLTCPHCRVAFKSEWDEFTLGLDADGFWEMWKTECPACERFVVILRHSEERRPSGLESRQIIPVPPRLKSERMVWPRMVARAPIPANVPESIARDYSAACRVLPESAEASAALSRRCLQNLLVEKATMKKRDLDPQIQEVIDSGILPTQLAEDLDVVRVIGNFAAHPIKSQSRGQIVEVEPGEAEWNLDVLEALFDFFFVQAEKRKKRRAALNEKLKDAGKKPLK